MRQDKIVYACTYLSSGFMSGSRGDETGFPSMHSINKGNTCCLSNGFWSPSLLASSSDVSGHLVCFHRFASELLSYYHSPSVYTLISGDPVSTVPMECRHFRKEGVIIVEGVYFLSIRTRTTDVESGTIVRVMQFELVAVGDCGQRIIL